jgi:hypothetical protein
MVASQAELEPTPPKKPAESAALTGHAAAAHGASFTFYGSHRVFLGPPPTGSELLTPHVASIEALFLPEPWGIEDAGLRSAFYDFYGTEL